MPPDRASTASTSNTKPSPGPTTARTRASVHSNPEARGRGFEQDAGSGARGTRTPDLLGAIQALSQLSYSPGRVADEAPRVAASVVAAGTDVVASMVRRRDGVARRGHTRTP